jgi:hypothetical protein
MKCGPAGLWFGDPWKARRLAKCGRQGQDGSRLDIRPEREGGPNLGQPVAPPTALRFRAPSPSWIAGSRYTPCTCSRRESTTNQRRVEYPAIGLGFMNIAPSPFMLPAKFSLRNTTSAYFTKLCNSMSRLVRCCSPVNSHPWVASDDFSPIVHPPAAGVGSGLLVASPCRGEATPPPRHPYHYLR